MLLHLEIKDPLNPTFPTLTSPKEKYIDMHQAGCKEFKFETLPRGLAEKLFCENGFDLAPHIFKTLGFFFPIQHDVNTRFKSYLIGFS